MFEYVEGVDILDIRLRLFGCVVLSVDLLQFLKENLSLLSLNVNVLLKKLYLSILNLMNLICLKNVAVNKLKFWV